MNAPRVSGYEVTEEEWNRIFKRSGKSTPAKQREALRRIRLRNLSRTAKSGEDTSAQS